jgi:ABC-type uncharacterized transport system substrate-binding protein
MSPSFPAYSVLLLVALGMSGSISSSERSQDIAIFYASKNTLTDYISSGIRQSKSTLYEPGSLVNSKDDCGNHSLLLAIGSGAIKAVINYCKGRNILAIDSRTSINEAGYGNIHGVNFLYTGQPPEKVVREVTKNFMSIKKIGVLVASEKEKLFYIKLLKSADAIITYQIVPPNDIPGQSFMQLINKTDAVLISSNNDIWNVYNIKAFLLTAIRKGKVLIGGSNPQFVKAGVFAGYYTDFERLGLDIGNSLKINMNIKFNGYYAHANFSFNKVIAKRLGVNPAKAE